MKTKKIEGVKFYTDTSAAQKNEPGIYHSYMACLATVINHLSGGLDPILLMGSSGFAFRIIVNETLCPSAMSMFPFADILPQAVQRAGYSCIYVSRVWNEVQIEELKRNEAHQAIIEGIERSVPAIVWDIADVEWGLIIGYNDQSQSYFTLSHRGELLSLPYSRLGKNGIDILSVAIAGNPNPKKPDEIVRTSLQTAVAHAEGKEWTDRPKYENGLAAYEIWAQAFEKWALIIEAGRSGNIGVNIIDFARYYAGHYYSARCYARDYLKQISSGSKHLQKAGLFYEKTVDLLRPLWAYFSEKKNPDEETLKLFAQNLRTAKAAEQEAIEIIKAYLSQL